jgi:hypothetical protein
MHIDETSTRNDLEHAAVFECNFDLDVIEAATDAELLEMIREWIVAGDECAAC